MRKGGRGEDEEKVRNVEITQTEEEKTVGTQAVLQQPTFRI